MDSRQPELNTAGSKIRAALDAESAGGQGADAVRRARKGFIDYVATRNAGGARERRASWLPGLRGWSLGLTGVAAVAAAVMVWSRLPITFQVDSDAEPAAVAGTAGDLIEANSVVPTSLRFSEGSSIILERGGQLRVLSLASNGARVLVEKGAADVAIAHRHGPGRWRFEAGPMTVDVTGTRFRVDWNPDNRSFAIDMKEGSVVLGGDCLGGVPRRVQRGDSLHLTCGPAAAATTAPAKSATAASPAIPEEQEKPAPTHAPHVVARHAARDARAADEPDWRALIAAGHYSEGVRAAERIGWNRVCRGANAVELLALADAARLSGETARAVEALVMLRQRFPGTSSAATGAFSLGRLAFEKRGAYGEAARWFAIYLDEQPHGPLMGDAVGRLMEARQRAGDRPAARRDAQNYLQRFPEGPYAGTARAILAE
jgi:TolA-binding protein